MKRWLVIGFLLFWGLAIFFMVNYFPTLRQTYKSKATAPVVSILRILPLVTYANQNWTETEIKSITQRYSGLIFRNQNLEQLTELIPLFKQSNSAFKIYYELSPTQTSTVAMDYPLLSKHKSWFLSGLTLDIRDPLYRQHFFDYWQGQLTKAGVDGLYLTNLNQCPIITGVPTCQAQYDWWSISLMDFMAQIRQSWSGQTILFEASPISTSSEEFSQQLLLQTDGAVLSDFGVIGNDVATFDRYYHYIQKLSENPQLLNKQLVFQVIGKEESQEFYQASYLLFAKGNSAYYFANSKDADINWLPEWQRLFSDSASPPQLRSDGLYERALGNVLVLVDPKSKAVQLIDLPESTVEPTLLAITPESADWSDKQTAFFADFEDIFQEVQVDSVILGDQVSLESEPKNIDDSDDGLYIDGLEAGVFNLNRRQVYDARLKLSRVGSSGYQLFVWADWDGKGDKAPEVIYKVENGSVTTVNFKIVVPYSAKDLVLFRVIVSDREFGEVEDYSILVQ